jgi:hypothetical protein
LMRDRDTTVKLAGVPLKLTAVAPAMFIPKILTLAPTLPEAGSVDTVGPRPTAKLKIVPALSFPPPWVSPYKSPLAPIKSCANGVLPSLQPLWAQKL